MPMTSKADASDGSNLWSTLLDVNDPAGGEADRDFLPSDEADVGGQVRDHRIQIGNVVGAAPGFVDDGNHLQGRLARQLPDDVLLHRRIGSTSPRIAGDLNGSPLISAGTGMSPSRICPVLITGNPEQRVEIEHHVDVVAGSAVDDPADVARDGVVVSTHGIRFDHRPDDAKTDP